MYMYSVVVIISSIIRRFTPRIRGGGKTVSEVVYAQRLLGSNHWNLIENRLFDFSTRGPYTVPMIYVRRSTCGHE